VYHDTYDTAGQNLIHTEPAVVAETKSKRVPYLDGWRGLALIGVLIDHFITKHGINSGRLGVEMFFVLSGRLMAEILFVRATPLANFVARRVSRVYPALFVLAICATLYASVAGKHDPTLGQFLSTITFTANYTRLWIGETKVLGHVWSLCIEEHMYLLLGIVALMWRRWNFPLVTVLTALALAFMVNGAVETAMGLSYYTVYWRSDARGASILVGAIAYLVLRDGVPRALAGRWPPIILGVAGLALSIKVVPDPIKYSAATACLAASLVLMEQAPAFALRILEHPLILRAGLWSYSIYLWQQPFFRGAVDAGIPRWWLLPMAIAAGVVSFYAIEQPARRWLNARWHTRTEIVRG